MARSVWEVFLAYFRDDDADGGNDEYDGQFVPSPLDLSVRIGHGSSESERVRELAAVDERARALEEADRET